MTQPLATILAALIAAFLGSWLGALVAFSRFKKERAFDRQLDWYERMLKAVHELAQRIEIAMTFQRESQTAADLLLKVWRDVQGAHLQLDSIASEATLFGSTGAGKIAEKLSTFVQDAANETDAFDGLSLPKGGRDKRLALIESLPERLRNEAKPLALEARRHLGLLR
jgi:hypothetical protein